MPKYELNFDMQGSGFTVNETAGENLGEHKLVYRGADGYWYLADADAAASMPVLGITMGAITSGRKGGVLLQGYIGDAAWTWTGGDEVYASTVAGELTQIAPTGAGDIVQVVAIAVQADIIQFVGNVGGASGGCREYSPATAVVGFNAALACAPNYFLADGVADEVTINAAIAYVGALGGGSVFLERGTYTLAANVLLNQADVMLLGQGADSILTIAAATDDCVEVNGVSGWKIGLLTLRTTGVGANDAITLVDADDGEIFSVIIDDSGQDGIVIDSDSIDNNIHDNKISNCTRYGINNSGDDGSLTNNKIDTTGNDGMWLQAGGTNNMVVGNRVSGWTGEGIDNDEPSNTLGHNNTQV